MGEFVETKNILHEEQADRSVSTATTANPQRLDAVTPPISIGLYRPLVPSRRIEYMVYLEK